MSSVRDLYSEYVVPTYGRFDLCIVRGQGCRVWDENGKAYLDFGAGIAVCSLGHAHPTVTEAVSRQARTLVHTSNLYFTQPQGQLARRLVEAIGIPGKIFFCNSGAEANEGLYKLARKYGNPGGRFEILTCTGSFHGRTLAGISATGQDKVKKGFEPLVEGFRHVPFNDLAAVEAAVGPRTAAILVEPIQGEGGIHIATPEFLQGLRRLCDERNLLLLFDEIQCGLGRTGHWGGWQAIAGSSVTPDGISWAKGIANGVPLGAFWVRRTKDEVPLCDILGAGTHGTTYGGNPLACAAGLAVMETVEKEHLRQHAIEAGAFLREELRGLPTPHIKAIRAVGLMIGIEFNDSTRELFPGSGEGTPVSRLLSDALMRQGLLVIPAGERVLRLLPPLNLSFDEAREAIGIFRRVLSTAPRTERRTSIVH